MNVKSSQYFKKKKKKKIHQNVEHEYLSYKLYAKFEYNHYDQIQKVNLHELTSSHESFI